MFAIDRTQYQYKLLEESYRQQRAFYTIDPRYGHHAQKLVERGYIRAINPNVFSPWQDWWEPTQRGYRIFKRWQRLKHGTSK